MNKIIRFFLVFIAYGTALEAADIDLPFYMSFDANDYSGQVCSTVGGATHTWLESGGWSGGAVKFTPPTGDGRYVGLCGFTGLQDDSTKQINIRFLIYYGSEWNEQMEGLKMIITNPLPEENSYRMMMFTDVPDAGECSGVRGDFATYGACHQGNTCKYDNEVYGSGQYASCDDSFRIGDRADGYREGEWISVEYEANTVTGLSRVYIYTQDGVFAGTYTEIYAAASPGEDFNYIDVIGGYANNGTGTPDPDLYYIMDELVIDDSYIGPPAGFLTSAPPSSTGISGTFSISTP